MSEPHARDDEENLHAPDNQRLRLDSGGGHESEDERLRLDNTAEILYMMGRLEQVATGSDTPVLNYRNADHRIEIRIYPRTEHIVDIPVLPQRTQNQIVARRHMGEDLGQRERAPQCWDRFCKFVVKYGKMAWEGPILNIGYNLVASALYDAMTKPLAAASGASLKPAAASTDDPLVKAFSDNFLAVTDAEFWALIYRGVQDDDVVDWEDHLLMAENIRQLASIGRDVETFTWDHWAEGSDIAWRIAKAVNTGGWAAAYGMLSGLQYKGAPLPRFVQARLLADACYNWYLDQN